MSKKLYLLISAVLLVLLANGRSFSYDYNLGNYFTLTTTDNLHSSYNTFPKGRATNSMQKIYFENEIFESKSLFLGNKGKLNIYPILNNNGILNLTYSNINVDAQVSMISMDGKVNLNKQILFSNGEAILNFNLLIGCYIIKRYFGNELFIRRLVVK